MDITETKERLLRLMSQPDYSPLRKRGLSKALHITDADYRSFRNLLDSMVKDSELVEQKGRYALVFEGTGAKQPAVSLKSPPLPVRPALASAEKIFPKGQPEVPKNARLGRVEVKRAGMGYLLSDPPGNDIFIAQEDLGGALSGDLVAVELKRRKLQGGRRGRGQSFSRPAARVIKVLERAHPRIVGTFYARGESGHIIPDTRGVFHELDVLQEDRGEAKHRDKVAIELIEPTEGHRSGQRPTARIVEVFGPAGEADADVRAIIENYSIRTEFPEDVLRQAEEIPVEIPSEELAQRTFYDDPITFTIDPADAKDHDDAVALRQEEDGRYTLLVHIADVSYYVPEDSPLDIEARERATSVYLPGTVYPMLPRKLSNNVCSLKEKELRLTKTVSITYGKNLTPQAIKIERSYIKSAAKLNYDQVKEALDEYKPELVGDEKIFEALQSMRKFALALREKRLATGSLNLELPEARLLLDEKLEVKGWVMAEHHWAHELIEDMMLAANRAVAEYLVDYELPGMFRIHEEPDPGALKRFSEFVREFGISIRPPVDRLKLKSVLERVKGKEYEQTIHLALLTSLKQARYAAECHPHFALNFNRYLHFTSPIRRYPDLVVHRALDARFEPGQAALPSPAKRRAGGELGRQYYARLATLRPLATHCSRKERDAESAEEEVIKFKQLQFLRRNLKAAHPGLITGVRDFGLFVELQDCHVQGMVRVEDLNDDFYEYFENQHLLQGRRKHRSFRLGDQLQVRIIHIDLGSKDVRLEII